MLFAPAQAAFLDDGIARPPEVCVGITQMRQKSISRFLTLGITLSIAIVLVFSAPRLRIGVFASLALTQEVG